MWSNRIVALISLSAVALLTQCSSDRESLHSFKTEEIDGVQTAINAGSPKFVGELFRYEKVLELEQDESRPESLLQSSVSFMVGDDGWFYVEDNYACRIAVFNPEGKYEKSIGREGSGPGEFSKYYWELRGLHGDVLNTYDSMLRRATRYGTDGTLIDVVTFPQEIIEASELQSLEGLIRSKQYLTPDGGWVIIGNFFEEQQNIRSTGIRFISYSAELERLGSAETLCIPNNYQFMRPMRGGREMPVWEGMPYAPDPEAVYIPGKGILMATGAEPLLEWYSIAGRLQLRIILDLPAVEVTAGDKAAYTAMRENQISEQQSEDMRQFLESQLESLKFPEFKTYWSSVSVDDAGYIWLRISESVEDREQLGGVGYRVLNPEGEYLGITRAPYLGEAVIGRFLAVVTDPETDERIPTVWRMVPQVVEFHYP